MKKETLLSSVQIYYSESIGLNVNENPDLYGFFCFSDMYIMGRSISFGEVMTPLEETIPKQKPMLIFKLHVDHHRPRTSHRTLIVTGDGTVVNIKKTSNFQRLFLRESCRYTMNKIRPNVSGFSRIRNNVNLQPPDATMCSETAHFVAVGQKLFVVELFRDEHVSNDKDEALHLHSHTALEHRSPQNGRYASRELDDPAFAASLCCLPIRLWSPKQQGPGLLVLENLLEIHLHRIKTAFRKHHFGV